MIAEMKDVKHVNLTFNKQNGGNTFSNPADGMQVAQKPLPNFCHPVINPLLFVIFATL